MNMFEWGLTLKFKDGNQETKEFEPLIWYEGPRMFVDKKGEFLLVWYEDKENEELWFLIKNPSNIREYIANKKTLKELMLEGPTFLVRYDFENDMYFVTDKLSADILKEKFVLPAEDSFLGNLYSKADKLLELLNASFSFYKTLPWESLSMIIYLSDICSVTKPYPVLKEEIVSIQDLSLSADISIFLEYKTLLILKHTQTNFFLSYKISFSIKARTIINDDDIEYSYGLAA